MASQLNTKPGLITGAARQAAAQASRRFMFTSAASNTKAAATKPKASKHKAARKEAASSIKDEELRWFM